MPSFWAASQKTKDSSTSSADARETIVRNSLTRAPRSDMIDFKDIASRTEGFNAADIEQLCGVAKMRRITLIDSGDPVEVVTPDDFEFALANIRSSVSEKDLEEIEEYRRRHGGTDTVTGKDAKIPGYS